MIRLPFECRVYTDPEFMHVVIPSIGFNKVRPMWDADTFLEEIAELGIDGSLPVAHAREACDMIDDAIDKWERTRRGVDRKTVVGVVMCALAVVGFILWWPL